MGVMAWKRSVLSVCGSLITDFYRPPAGVLLPCGHIVSDLVPLHVKNLFRIPSPSKLKSDIDFLARHYRPLAPSELEQLSDNYKDKRPAKYFVLSFDDGMREVYDIIAPILRVKGIPAVFFLNSTTIDNKQLMWRHQVSLLVERAQRERERVPPPLKAHQGRTISEKLLSLRFADKSILDEIAEFYEFDSSEYLRSRQPYLTTDQILELARQGFEFGAHSASHPCFNDLSIENQKKEISESVRFVRALGLPCRYFAFPFHDNGVPVSVFKYMRELGLVLSFGTSDARIDCVPFSLQRFALDAENSALAVPDILDQLSAKSLALRMSRTEVIRRN
jgi:peptidoglycan/xylan/chitin deacetylase (PgdA/CDA1 family)